jgi:polysaccharide biosynthesis/export protein
MNMTRTLRVFLWLVVVAGPAGTWCLAQQTQATQPAILQSLQQQTAQPATLPSGDTVRPNYTLGPNDQITVRAPGVDEVNEKSFRISPDGTLSLPLIGILRVAGLSVQELEAQLATRLKAYVLNPQVTIAVIQFRSEPVFFVGAFKAPGIYALQGRRTLLEMFTVVGGLQPNTSRRIKITRRLEFGPLPLPNATEDREKGISTAEISLSSLRENINPAEDIALQPFDTISVDRAEMVYVNGLLNKLGGFELGERDSISAVQLLALAGGASKDADLEQAKVLRPVLDTARRAEIPLNLKRILAGKANDFPLQANDVLYVPSRRGGGTSRALTPMALGLIPALLSAVIYVAIR